MNDTHLGPRCLPITDDDAVLWRSRSRFCWSIRPSGKIVIFVHGFGGEALRTWEQFVSLWPEEHAGWDIAFFGYDSLGSQVGNSSAAFLEFLEIVLATPATTINSTLTHLFSYQPELRRENDFSYSEVVIIAHSLGAVVSRQALVLSQNAKWIRKTKLVLFAPAHKGALPLGLLIEALTSISFGPALGAGVKFAIPSLLGVERNGTNLKKLESDTMELLNKGWGRPYTASCVVYAEKEKVVINEQFGRDPRPILFHGKNHRQVCKPLSAWQKPLEIVTVVLSGDRQ